MREFLSLLRAQGEIVDISCEVDPRLELPEIHRRVIAQEGPALLFHNVKGSSFPVVTNLFGTPERLALAFPQPLEELVGELVHMLTREMPPTLGGLWRRRRVLKRLIRLGTKEIRNPPVAACRMDPPNLERLPFLTCWPEDGGPFLTLPLIYTEGPSGGPPNLGIYRVQRYSETEAGLHFQIAKGGGFHYHQAEREGRPLPVTIFLGGPPALLLSAVAPLPENVSELLFASLLAGRKLPVGRTPLSPYPLLAECEFALVGESLPHERRLEGPFGDHYGYYSLAHDFPLFRCRALFHRKDAIYPATVVGKPYQEDYFLGNLLQRALSPLFPVVMPGVRALWSYGETGFHSLAAAVVTERYYRECMTTAFRILGEGQLALTKFLLITDQPVDVTDFKAVLTTILERFVPERDLFLFGELCLDTLDYTGPELNKGSRGVMLGIGPKRRELPHLFSGTPLSCVRTVQPFSPGCLVVEVEAGGEEVARRSSVFDAWPLVILVDSVSESLQSTCAFLWSVFTRFNPAADLSAKEVRLMKNHPAFSGPIWIDARMKPGYPGEVVVDAETRERVTRRWATEYGLPKRLQA